MAVREFTDSEGVEWRVWDVTPLHMHPATRTEDYMGNLQDGWLVFESEADKRRLEAPYPADWTSFALNRLEALCGEAKPVIRRTPSGQQVATPATDTQPQVAPAPGPHCQFTSPGGREWTVRIHESPDRGGTHQIVLRFTSGDIVLELTEWPPDWSKATVSQYAMMLLDATPPRRLERGSGPQRRSDDRPIGQRDDSSIRA